MARWHVEKRMMKNGKPSYRVKVELPPDPTTQKRQTKTGTFRTSKEAEAAGKAWIVEVDNGMIVKNTSATVADVCSQWLEVKKHDLLPRTFLHYEATVKKITDSIGSLPVQRVQPANIDALYALLRNGGASEDAVHRVHMRLVQIFDYATKRRIISGNPMHAIDAPIVRTKAATILTAAQITQFLTSAQDDGYNPLWLILVQTGLRRGEALGFRWKDLDLDDGKLSVRQTVECLKGKANISTPKTKASARTIMLFPESVAALKMHRSRQLERRMRAQEWEDNDLVFCTPSGRMLNPNNVARNFSLIKKRANAKAQSENVDPLPSFTIHDLRHTHASHLLAENWSIPKVSRRLGHATPAITMAIYAHAIADEEGIVIQTPAAFAFTGTA